MLSNYAFLLAIDLWGRFDISLKFTERIDHSNQVVSMYFTEF